MLHKRVINREHTKISTCLNESDLFLKKKKSTEIYLNFEDLCNTTKRESLLNHNSTFSTKTVIDLSTLIYLDSIAIEIFLKKVGTKLNSQGEFLHLQVLS